MGRPALFINTYSALEEEFAQKLRAQAPGVPVTEINIEELGADRAGFGFSMTIAGREVYFQSTEDLYGGLPHDSVTLWSEPFTTGFLTSTRTALVHIEGQLATELLEEQLMRLEEERQRRLHVASNLLASITNKIPGILHEVTGWKLYVELPDVNHLGSERDLLDVEGSKTVTLAGNLSGFTLSLTCSSIEVSPLQAQESLQTHTYSVSLRSPEDLVAIEVSQKGPEFMPAFKAALELEAREYQDRSFGARIRRRLTLLLN